MGLPPHTDTHTQTHRHVSLEALACVYMARLPWTRRPEKRRSAPFLTIGVLLGRFGRKNRGRFLVLPVPGGLVIYQGNPSIALKGHLC